MNAMRLMFVSAISLALLASCREPNAPQAPSQPVPPSATADNPGADAVAAPGGQPGAAQAATLCNIETIGGQLLGATPMVIDGTIGVKGWLADHTGEPPGRPRLVIADVGRAVVREIPIELSLERPDVVKAYPDQDGLERSGFEADLDPAGLHPQIYHLYLAYSVGQVSYLCDNGRYLLVR